MSTYDNDEGLQVEYDDEFALLGRFITALAGMGPKELGEIVDFAKFLQQRRHLLGALPIVTTAAA